MTTATRHATAPAVLDSLYTRYLQYPDTPRPTADTPRAELRGAYLDEAQAAWSRAKAHTDKVAADVAFQKQLRESKATETAKAAQAERDAVIEAEAARLENRLRVAYLSTKGATPAGWDAAKDQIIADELARQVHTQATVDDRWRRGMSQQVRNMWER